MWRAASSSRHALGGQLTMVIVPHGSGPGSTLHVQVPIRPSRVQKYAVTIPNNVQPGAIPGVAWRAACVAPLPAQSWAGEADAG